MTIDEAIHYAETEIEVVKQSVGNVEPYDVARVCGCLLDLIILIKEALSELNPE